VLTSCDDLHADYSAKHTGSKVLLGRNHRPMTFDNASLLVDNSPTQGRSRQRPYMHRPISCTALYLSPPMPGSILNPFELSCFQGRQRGFTEKAPFIPVDEVMYPFIDNTRCLVRQVETTRAVERAIAAESWCLFVPGLECPDSDHATSLRR
jgi:hypothetical protein